MKKLVYNIIDLLTLGKGIAKYISGFALKLPTRFYKYFESDYELNNINFINNYVSKGMTAIDVGAHIGLLSVIMAKKVGTPGKVFSFEPTPSTFALLTKTIEINEVSNIVKPINKAVADKAGQTSFYVTDIAAHNSNSLSNNKREYGNEKKIDVELVSLDDLAIDKKLTKVDFIKIDAEGAEYAVLKGAQVLLAKHRPKVILALHPNSIVNFGDSLSQIWDYILDKNYRVFLNNDELNKTDFCSKTDLFDVFLLPNVE